MSITRRISILTVAAGLVTGGALGVTGPASAAPTGDTTTTFTIEAGTLDIVAPATADLGTGGAGSSLSGQLGPVTVADGRAALGATWTASVSSTDFSTGGGSGAEIIDTENVSYWSGFATATTGTGTFTPGQANSGASEQLDQSRTAFVLSGGSGSNSATWNPTVNIDVPGAGIAGTYSGTITHSVA